MAQAAARRAAIARRAPSRRAVALAGLAAPLGLSPPATGGAPRDVPILTYHRFDPRAAGPATVTVTAFEAQLNWLADNRYRIAPLREAAAGLSRSPPVSAPPTVAVTVDDGHRSVHALLLPLIRARRIPVTLFVYPSAISNAAYALTWDQLREMRATGLVDVQSHTYWHPNFRTERRRRTAADFGLFVDHQLTRSRQVLQARLGAPVDMLAWPFGIVDAELESAARRAGYRFGFGYDGGPARPGADPLALPRIPVTDADRGERFAALLGASVRRAPP